ncbi:bifunctional diguanylate cyclase/phosphodiesterase [Duganella qianjiadongensis]|uniref:bifunctional diguanylate cyclase/phosphodiesterase n=1 Tax=Duganella qianjiadongensis TaxID=2692176 RepID=UPI001927C062
MWTEKRIDRANEKRFQSQALVEELRHSSDDLTRMARSYIITGEAHFRSHYLEILDIRDGRAPRPLRYEDVYWDLVLDGEHRPRPSGPAIPLLEMMRAAGFTDQEMELLAQSKRESDRLSTIERNAIGMRDRADVTPEALQQAMLMLHNPYYHHAKARIMSPIGQVSYSVEQRTLMEVRLAENDALLARIIFGLSALGLLVMLWRTKRSLDTSLGCNVEQLQRSITRLGQGELDPPLLVAPGARDTVWGWVGELQRNLARLEQERLAAQARTHRLSRLYMALSQCNQAIVRCRSEHELFQHICDAIVTHGGMSMAWIGAVDGAHHTLAAVAWAGVGTKYLEQVHLSLSADVPEGCGPAGLSYRSGEPYWCQNFMEAEETRIWHARAAEFGWAASTAIPLRRQGKVVAILSAYSDARNAFDEDAQNLLMEMRLDIEFALKNFDHQQDRKRTEENLRKSEQRLRTIIETEPECVMLIDAAGKFQDINAAGLRMLQADSLETLQQTTPERLILPEYREAFNLLLRRVMAGESGHLEFRIQGLQGEQRLLETHAAPMDNAPGQERVLLGITRDVTERRLADERIQYLAHYDALTGLPNRTQLQEHAHMALALARRQHSTLALLMLDLDHFKDINDSLGHSVGDQLLCELATRLRGAMREQDMVARLGGDEFIFVLQGLNADEVASVAQKLLDLIDRPFRIGIHDLKVTASLGVAIYPADGEEIEALLQRADAAMYQVKRSGRHGIRFFTSAMQQRAARHLQLVNALRYAIERDQLHVLYQPQVALRERAIIGAEALLRWETPELGKVSPAEFIPAAEESGLIQSIGAWVLREAVRQAVRWRSEGLPPVTMAVNLSAVQFRNTDLPKLITRILQEEGLPAEYLELELTEAVAANDPQGAIAMMNKLHERGVRMSIDDFGTGFSSLSHLKKFMAYKLKIDQSFVRDITTDAEDRAIVNAIIQMARSLGMRTIAEGVETVEQLSYLHEHLCDEIQGYYFSRPVTATAFRQLLLDGAARAFNP